MLLELGLPSFDTIIHNYSVRFSLSLGTCDNLLVKCLLRYTVYYLQLIVHCISIMSVHVLQSVCIPVCVLLFLCVLAVIGFYVCYGPSCLI